MACMRSMAGERQETAGVIRTNVDDAPCAPSGADDVPGVKNLQCRSLHRIAPIARQRACLSKTFGKPRGRRMRTRERQRPCRESPPPGRGVRLGGPEDRVEQQAECRERFRAMLDEEAAQANPARTDRRGHYGRAAL